MDSRHAWHGGNTAPSIGIIRTGTKGLSQHVLPERRDEYPCAKAKYRANCEEGWYYCFTIGFSLGRQCHSGSVHFFNETPGG